MTPAYHLSNRQRKELMVRGAELRIAIPAPMDQDYDELAFARAALAVQDIRDDWIVAAEEETLAISPTGSGEGLDELLGGFTDDPAIYSVPTVCVVATLCISDRPRHRDEKIQWPAAVVCGGWRFPK